MAAAIRAATGLLGSLLAIRLLGVGHYGHLATWLSLFVLYLTLNSSAFTMLVVRLMTTVGADQAPDRGNATAAAVAFCVGSLALLASATFLLAGYVIRLAQFGDTLPPEFGRAIVLMGLLTAIQIFVALQAALVEGAGRLDLATKSQLAGPIFIVATLVFCFLSGAFLDINKYLLLLSAGALIDGGLLWLVRRKLTLPLLLSTQTTGRMDGVVQLLRSGGVLQVSSLLTLFLEPANKFILNHFVGAAAVTIYDLAMKVIWGIQHLFGSAMRIFLHIGSQDRDAVGRNFAKVILLLGVPVVGLHIVGAVFLLWAARHWMMIDASQLMAFFGIAAISNFGMTFVTPLYLSLIGRRDLFFIFRTHLVLAVVNLLVSTAMIPLLGLVGSAFGLLVATALNVAAIYGRCGINAATFVSEEQAVSRVKYRIGAVLGLLAATIAWGTYGNDSPLAVFGILLVLAGIMVREPFVGAVLNRIVLKRP